MSSTARTAAVSASPSLATPARTATGSPRRSAPALLLRVEGLLLAAAAVVGFHALGGHWGWFAALLLLPDLSLLGWLHSPRWGARLYNAAHVMVGPAALGALALALNDVELGRLAATWLAHIGLDRAMGYGLKYPTAFKDTHLGRL